MSQLSTNQRHPTSWSHLPAGCTPPHSATKARPAAHSTPVNLPSAAASSFRFGSTASSSPPWAGEGGHEQAGMKERTGRNHLVWFGLYDFGCYKFGAVLCRTLAAGVQAQHGTAQHRSLIVGRISIQSASSRAGWAGCLDRCCGWGGNPWQQLIGRAVHLPHASTRRAQPHSLLHPPCHQASPKAAAAMMYISPHSFPSPPHSRTSKSAKEMGRGRWWMDRGTGSRDSGGCTVTACGAGQGRAGQGRQPAEEQVFK